MHRGSGAVCENVDGRGKIWCRALMYVEFALLKYMQHNNTSVETVLTTSVNVNSTRNTFCRTRSLSNATFSFLITWRSSSSKSAAVYKISSQSDDYSLRYGDISIFKMAVVRHLGIVLPPYETTHEVCCWPQLPVKFHVNLTHRSEAIWIFRIFGLKCLFSPPKWGFWSTLDP